MQQLVDIMLPTRKRMVLSQQQVYLVFILRRKRRSWSLLIGCWGFNMAAVWSRSLENNSGFIAGFTFNMEDVHPSGCSSIHSSFYPTSINPLKFNHQSIRLHPSICHPVCLSFYLDVQLSLSLSILLSFNLSHRQLSPWRPVLPSF